MIGSPSQSWARPTSALLLVAVAACSSPTAKTEQQSDALVSEHASPIAVEAWQLQPWWQDFASADLNHTIDGVLQNNLDLRAAAAQLHQLELQTQLVAGQKMPSVSASLGAGRSRTNLIGLPIPGAPSVLPITNSQANLGLNLSWELDLWGRIDAEEDAALAQWQAGTAEWQGAQLSLAGQASKVWFAAVAADVELRLSEELAATAHALADHIGKRYRQGLAPADLWNSARNTAQQMDARLHSVKINRDQQLRALQSMRSGNTYQTTASGLATQLPDLPPTLAADLPAQVVARRPDLRATEARLLAAHSEHSVARASLYPRLALTASGGTMSETLGDLLDGDLRVWSLAGNLVAPLFEGGRLRNQVELRAAGISQAELEFTQRALLAYAEVESALLAEQELREQWQTMAEVHDRSKQDLQRAERRYQQGVGSLATTLQSRMDQQQKELELLQTHLMVLINRIDLYLALGGDLRPLVSAT